MIVRWLGSVPYLEALALQEELVGKKAANDSLDDELLLRSMNRFTRSGGRRIKPASGAARIFLIKSFTLIGEDKPLITALASSLGIPY